MPADFLYRALSVGDLKTSLPFYRDGLPDSANRRTVG